VLPQRSSPALIDLLPWETPVAEGVLRLTDGALLAGFEIRGPDVVSAGPTELEALSSAWVKALQPLGDGWMIHLEAQRFPAPGYPAPGAFPDAFSRALDEERRRAFERGDCFTSQYFLSVTYKPAGKLPRPTFAEAWRGCDQISDTETPSLTELEARLAELAQVLATQIEIERLETDELLSLLYRCLSCRNHPVGVPRGASSLEAVFGVGDFSAGFELELGGMALVPVAVTGFPTEATPAALDFLNQLAFPYRVCFRLLLLDPYTARSAISRKRTHWAAAGVGLKQLLVQMLGKSGDKPRFTDRFAPEMARDADDALLELSRQDGGACYLTTTVHLFDPDRRQALGRAEVLLKELRARGFGGWVERVGAAESFLGSLPGCGWYGVRRPIFLLRPAVDLALTTSIWTGSPKHPHPRLADQPAHVVTSTEESTPFYLSLAESDVQHTLIVGPTGAGKSVLLGLVALQYLRYPDAQVFSIDSGWSLLAPALAAGGHHYPLSPDGAGSDHRFAPLAVLETAEDRQRALEWTEELLRLQGLDLTPALRSLLVRALDLLAASPGKTLSRLATKLQHQDLRAAIAPYTQGGPYGHLFDGEANPLRQGGHLHVFEMEAVLPLKRAVVTPLVLHLLSEIERRLDGRPTLILLDEAAQYLGDTLWAGKLAAWLYQLRKKNAGLVLATQSLTSILESDLKAPLLESAPTRIYLPNPAARTSSAAESYRAFGLTRRQIEIIATATPRRDYYVTTPKGSRLVRFDLSPGALAVLGLSGPEGRRKVSEVRQEHGEAWLPQLLHGAGGSALAELLVEPSPPQPVHPTAVPTDPQPPGGTP